MDWKEKLARASQLFEQAKTILSDENATAEDKAKIEPMLEDAKKLKREALQLREIAEAGVEELLGEMKRREEQKADNRPPTGKFKSFGEFLFTVWKASTRGERDPRLTYFDESEKGIVSERKAALSEAVGATGGFLVPAEFQAQLQAVVADTALVRPRATVIPMRRRQVNIPVLDQTGTTGGVPHWFGGMKAYWVEEAAQKNESEPTFRLIELVAHKLIVYSRSSDELLDDSAISLEAFLGGPMGMPGAIAWEEDYTFINGTGAGQPLGVINAAATINVPRQSYATPIQYADLANMLECFLPSGRGVWFITQSAMADLIQMAGPTGNPSYIWGNAVSGVPNTLLGYPVVWTEKVPRVGNNGDVVLADWRYYLIGDRQATTVESTQYDRWQYDQTSWRAVHRVDGQPWLSAPLTYQDGVTQVSPFVILGAKST